LSWFGAFRGTGSSERVSEGDREGALLKGPTARRPLFEIVSKG
jgi:hypothetical protein